MRSAATPWSPRCPGSPLPAPQFGGTRVSTSFSATGYWIPKGARNKDAAWKVFVCYFGGQSAKDRATSGWGIPSLKSLRSQMPQSTAFQKQAFQVQQREPEYFKVLTFTPYVQLAGLDAVFSQTLPQMVNSGTPAGKVADKLNSLMNDQIAKGKQALG
ncbi:hypothetical protein [Streptomyces sp. NPDC058457]|uniref:hypothetical protein n=1 Tax=Streptomyces sp. NPDC058457 TaxID=3346507 RepID=UPI00364C5894